MVSRRAFASRRLKVSNGLEMTTERVTVVYREDIVATDSEDSGYRLRRSYSQMQLKKNDAEMPLHLDGKIILIEKKRDKFSFRFQDGEEVAGLASETLLREFSKRENPKLLVEDEMLPRTSVKPGATWTFWLDSIYSQPCSSR